MPPKTQTGFRVPRDSRGTCAGCGNPGGNDAATKLKVCQQCGGAAYCSAACQRAEWKTHKTWCKLAASTYKPEDSDGLRRLLFDRAFGGAYSLFERERFKETGDGILVAELSHPVAEFCGANRASDDPRGCRSMKFSWVPERFVGGLAHDSLAPDQTDTLLDGAMGVVANLRKTLKETVQRDLTPEMFFVLAVREPHKRGLSVHLMMNWLNPQHGVIPVFQQLRKRLPAQERNELTLEWEFRQDYSSFGAMQELLHRYDAPIGPKFHAECIQLYEEHRKAKDPGMWPNDECIPPLAKMMDMRAAPNLPPHMIGSHAADTPPLLHKTVRVTGLKSKVELNGRTGTVQAFDGSTGRYTVQFEPSESVVAIKGGNLELVEGEE